MRKETINYYFGQEMGPGYGAAARIGWPVLISFINENKWVSEVCEETNKNNERMAYLGRKRNFGDIHWEEPVL